MGAAPSWLEYGTLLPCSHVLADMNTHSRPRVSYAQPPWAQRRLSLLQVLAVRPQAVNCRGCPRLDKGVKASTRGGDLRRLIDEGLARLEHKPARSGQTRLLPSGERTKKPSRLSCPKQVVLTESGRAMLDQLTPAPARVAQPWARRRAALAEAGVT